MGKVKWSFSLLLAIFLVGILSTAAFAASVVYTLKTVQNGSGLEVSFTGNPADAGGYNIIVKDESNVTVQTDQVTLNSSNIGTLNISSGVLTVGKTYTFLLYKASDSSTLLSKASVVINDGNSTVMKNSNMTGYNNLGKQRTGQKMHGFYQNNTSSCASCHQTHTAKDSNLLFKSGVYDTCNACHDGTTAAITSTTSDSIEGTFNVSDDVNHGSFHQADGSLQISAAPGGDNSTDSSVTGTSLYMNTWGQNFDCASCHEPHGGGSLNENNLNPDPMGWGSVVFDSKSGDVVGTDSSGNQIISTADNKYGKLFKNIQPIDTTAGSTVPNTESTPYILVIKEAGTDAGNYWYTRVGVQPTDKVIQTYRWDGTKYIPDYSLWLRDLGYKNSPFQNANTVLYDSTDQQTRKDITTTNMTVVWRDGFAFGSGVANVKAADISIGIDVETTSDVQSLYPVFDSNGQITNSSTYIPDSGIQMTNFCTACHTEYLTDLSTGATGVTGTLAGPGYHRHIGITDDLTCVRCHFAHGTKEQIMKSITTGETDNLSNINHSSALRRYMNNDSCYANGCHQDTDSSKPNYLQWSY